MKLSLLFAPIGLLCLALPAAGQHVRGGLMAGPSRPVAESGLDTGYGAEGWIGLELLALPILPRAAVAFDRFSGEQQSRLDLKSARIDVLGILREVPLEPFGFAGCDDPLTVRDVSPVDRSIRVFMVLDSDSTRQALLLESLDPGGIFEDLREELHAPGGVTVVGQNDPDVGLFAPCAQRYGDIVTNAASACVVFETAVEPGGTYELVVTARQRPTAQAWTTVPDEFSIVARSLEGHPPGTGGVDVHWNPSPGAHGYFAFLWSGSTHCFSVLGCKNGWLISTTDTVVSGTIPEESLEDGSGPWTFDVLALDRGLYQYLTSGTGNDLFSVPPIENVEGGHGVLGSWTRATRSSQHAP